MVPPGSYFVNLEAQLGGVSHFSRDFKSRGVDLSKVTIVSPDAGGMKRAKAFHQNFETLNSAEGKIGMAVIEKQRSQANMVGSMQLIGNVEGQECVLVDDMIDTAGTICLAAKTLKEHGATKVYGFATHGLFSGPAGDRVRDSAFERIVVSDSVPLKDDFAQKVGSKVQQESLDLLLAEAIRR